jgi:hypothetical protein
MKFYTLETIFTFGKYEGMNLKGIVEIQSSYLNWCIVNLDHFYVSNEVIEEIKALVPDFNLSGEATEILEKKYYEWNDINDYANDDWEDDRDYERDSFDALTDG